MNAEERVTKAALDTLDVAQRSGLDLDALEEEIRLAASRIIWRQAETSEAMRGFTAYHEAAHAVACGLLGIPYLMAHLGPEDASSQPTLGRVILEGPDPTDRTDVENFCVMLFAGVAAETLAGNGANGGDIDLLRARQVAAILGYSDDAKRDFLNLAGTRARDLVRGEWRWVKAVARQLLERGTITAFDVEALRPVPDEEMAA